MFVMEGSNKKEEIPSMPGQYRYSVDRMEEKLAKLQKAGVNSVMFFGIPEHKERGRFDNSIFFPPESFSFLETAF